MKRQGTLEWFVDSIRGLRDGIGDFVERWRTEGPKQALREVLKNVTFDTGIGIYLDREWMLLFVAEVARTPVGKVLVREDIIPIVEGQDGALDVEADGTGSVPAAVGIGSKDVFYLVEEVQRARGTKKKEKDLLTLMQESTGEHSLASDVLPLTVQQHDVVARVACRSTAVDAIRPYCAKAGYDIAYCEPAGMSALRASYEFAPRPTKTVCQLRILLGPQEGLAALLYGSIILAYESIAKPDNRAVTRTVRLLEQFVQSRSFCPPIDEILIMGDRAAIDWLDLAAISTCEVKTCESKPYGELIAWGLGLRLLSEDQNDVNLAVTVKQILPLREALDRVVRPWEVGVVAVLLAALWFYQDYQCVGLVENLAGMNKRSKAQSAELSRMKKRDLDATIKELEENGAKFRSFLDDRVAWAPMLAGIAGLLPAGAVVTSFIGADAFAVSKKSKTPGRSVTLEVTMVSGGRDKALKAEQVDELIQQLRQSPSFERYFKSVELSRPVDWVTADGHLAQAKLALACNVK